MKRFLCLMWLLPFVFVLLACAPAPVEPALILGMEASSVGVGESIQMVVRAENVRNLTAFEAHLAFDPAMLEVVQVQAGELLRPDFVVQDVFDNAAGTLDYAMAQIGEPAGQEQGILLVITFRARAAGQTLVDFRSTPAAPQGAVLADSNGQAIPVTLLGAELRIDP